MLVEPLGKLNVPWDGRLAERAYLLDQARRQKAPPSVLMVYQPLAEGTAVEVVEPCRDVVVFYSPNPEYLADGHERQVPSLGQEEGVLPLYP